MSIASRRGWVRGALVAGRRCAGFIFGDRRRTTAFYMRGLVLNYSTCMHVQETSFDEPLDLLGMLLGLPRPHAHMASDDLVGVSCCVFWQSPIKTDLTIPGLWTRVLD